MSRIDFDSAILAARFVDGGEAVNCGDSTPLPLHMPEPQPEVRTVLRLPRDRAFRIGAWMALGGVALFAQAAVRHFFF